MQRVQETNYKNVQVKLVLLPVKLVLLSVKLILLRTDKSLNKDCKVL